MAAVDQVRKRIRNIRGFKSVDIVERENNFGLAKNIVSGVSEVCNSFDRVIVVEDDIVTHPGFLTYMNKALEMYANNESVASISGYAFPVKARLPEQYFLKMTCSWGWATWKQSWNGFNENGEWLLKELKRKGAAFDFDLDGTYGFYQMLENWCLGINDSWGIRWYASNYLNKRLTLFPGTTMVTNIGNDGTGTHGGNTTAFDSEPEEISGDIKKIDILERKEVREELVKYFQAMSRF